jgi:Arc/MetJ-type ribon-helix-helix transcriptional regulator
MIAHRWYNRAMKIAIHLPDRLKERLDSHMSRNGISASEIVRTAMIEYFDRLDAKHALTVMPYSAAEKRELKLEPGQTGGFGIQTGWGGEK